MKCLLLLQALLTFHVDGSDPVRFGFPLRAEDLDRGLRLDRPHAGLQWRRLQERPDPVTGRIWVEFAVDGVSGRVRVLRGGRNARAANSGQICVHTTRELQTPDGDVEQLEWRWRDGSRDSVTRTVFRRATPTAESTGRAAIAPGEAVTVRSDGCLGRATRVRIAASAWRAAGVLRASGPRAVALRADLVAAARRMRTLPGVRGRGDYARSGGVVTNLEFDTAFALLQLGLVEGCPDLIERGLESARHTVDHDLDPITGLPFRHGADHRAVPPEPGHTWLRGILLAGALSADRGLIRAAESIALGLARHPARARQPRDERARDFAWPLAEIEAWLRFAPAPACERAADTLAHEIGRRWDPRNEVVRFGEGEPRDGGDGAYTERAWLTAGMVLPALRAHLQRVPDPRLQTIVATTQRRLARLLRRGREGIPVRYRVRDGVVESVVRVRNRAAGFFVLEGLATRDLRRLLQRKQICRALREVPGEDDPDLATSFTLAARCGWITE